jgi:hypothetical protein
VDPSIIGLPDVVLFCFCFVLCCVNSIIIALFIDGLIADRSIFAAAAAEVSQTENNPQGIGLMFAT